MNTAFSNLLQEFLTEVRIRRRRTGCEFERQAAKRLEQEFERLLAQSKDNPAPFSKETRPAPQQQEI